MTRDAPEGEDTPLPAPLAHHVADPTHTATDNDFESPTDADRDVPRLPDIDARGEIDLAEALPTRQLARLSAPLLAQLASPPTVEIERLPPPLLESDVDTDTEDETTNPRELPRGMMQRGPRPIAESPLFAALPPDARAAALARFSQRGVAAGAIAIRQGELGHALLLVVRGRLQVRAERADGQVVTLGYVRDGEFIGEGSLLARAPSPVQVVATEPSELLALSPKDTYELARAYPAVWAELKDFAERRARDWDARLARR